MIFSGLRARLQGRPTQQDALSAKNGGTAAPQHQRFLTGQVPHAERLIRAARECAGRRLDPRHLYEKPFDASPGSPRFFAELYQVLNLLQAMDIPAKGRVLEVGSGPGWVTEILMGLRFDVDAMEPSADMIAIASERVADAVRHYRLDPPPHVAFHCCTLENNDLPDGAFDAVLFHAALHHVVDEERGLAECFRLLRPGGVLGVSEAAWKPDDDALEGLLEQKMRLCGALENPFTANYLDYLLRKHGFDDVCRYHGINGLFPAAMGGLSIADAAQCPLEGSNTLTAIKPDTSLFAGPTTASGDADTRAEITIVDAWLDTMGNVQLQLRLTNRGETAWLHNRKTAGRVRLALWQRTAPDASPQREASERVHLPRTVLPGQQVELAVSFAMPRKSIQGSWYLDLVNEGHFWFSQRGTVPATIKVTALEVRP